MRIRSLRAVMIAALVSGALLAPARQKQLRSPDEDFAGLILSAEGSTSHQPSTVRSFGKCRSVCSRWRAGQRIGEHRP